VNYLTQLLPFYNNVAPILDVDSLFEVTEAMAHVVVAQPLNRVYEVMGLFCNPIADQLVTLQQQGEAATPEERKKVSGITFSGSTNLDYVELLTIFIQTVVPWVEPGDEHPVVKLLVELFPKISHTLDVFGSDQVIAESVCKNFKNIIYAYRAHSLVLLPEMIRILETAFKQYGYGSFLWVSGAIVRQFGHEDLDPGIQLALWRFVETQCLSVFQLLQNNKPNDVPDCKAHRFGC
jgi:transportin-3